MLSLDGVDPQLMMEGENLMWVSHDAVFVLQHPGDPITLRLVQQTLPYLNDSFSMFEHMVTASP